MVCFFVDSLTAKRGAIMCEKIILTSSVHPYSIDISNLVEKEGLASDGVMVRRLLSKDELAEQELQLKRRINRLLSPKSPRYMKIKRRKFRRLLRLWIREQIWIRVQNR